MVARHFSDKESADWLEDDGEAPIPQVSEDLFHVPVSENALADEAARLRVEEIMRELEEELRSTGAHARAEKTENTGLSSEGRAARPMAAAVPDVAPAPVSTEDIDEPETPDSFEDPEGPDESEDGSRESTLVLDRGNLVSAMQERKDADEEPDERKRERLRVNPNPQGARRETGLSVVPKEEPRRRFGFFAAIGEFVARVLHLDDM